jgi:type I restriction enzyme S subunit
MVGVHRADDVLYGKLRPYLRKAIVADQDGLCSTEFLVLSPRRSTAPWLHRWLLTPEVTQQIEAGCDGAKMPRADWEYVGSIPIPLPPFAEQTAIATVIDRETARIDALIQKKTRFIELLKEKRQALITHAVTKGLDPNVKMKDSGVEWIGQVPEHWEVKRLKHLISQCQNGVWGDDPLEDGSDTLCIRVADFDRDKNVVICNPSTYRQITKEHQDSRLVSKGDILLEKSGGGAQTLVGANVRYLGEEPAVCSNFVAVIKPSKKAESAWLNYLMASMYALKINLRSIKQSTGIQNLDSEQYLDEGVAAPSLDEQATIAATLDRETARIDALIGKAEQSITLLKERRSAFITAAVTGQIDLRGEQ